jgi:hypothetical protein
MSESLENNKRPEWISKIHRFYRLTSLKIKIIFYYLLKYIFLFIEYIKNEIFTLFRF